MLPTRYTKMILFWLNFSLRNKCYNLYRSFSLVPIIAFVCKDHGVPGENPPVEL